MSGLNDVLVSTDMHLKARPSRAPDYQAESKALSRLAMEMATRPDNVLHALCEQVLIVCDAESAGVSLLGPEESEGDFIWPAVAGAWAQYTGGGMPRNASPCGVVVECKAPLLFQDVEVQFPAVAHANPRIREILLAPFCLDGKAIGTVWAILHSNRKQFDREDRRLLESIANFAAACHQLYREAERRSEGERRRDALIALGDKLRDTDNPQTIVQMGAHCLAVGLGADRTGFGMVDVEEETVDVLADWCTPGIASVKGRHHLRAFGSTIDALKAGRTIAIPDVRQDGMTMAEAATYDAISARSLMNLPIMEQGRLVSMMFASHDRVHHWSKDELNFVRQVGDQLHVARARIHAERQQETLNLELSHRLKNTLAMVQAIASQTLRSVTEQDAVEAFTQRLQALSSAHDLLMKKSWATATIGDVARSVLAAFDLDGRFDLTGETIAIGSRATLSLSLLLHELATNATKYGSLSVPGGRVVLHWRVSRDGAQPIVTLEWSEHGGPPAHEPTGRGFGSRLLRIGLVGSGGVALRYRNEGLSASMTAPLHQMQQA